MIFLRFWFPVIVYSGIIFYVSSLSSVSTPQSIPHLDKVYHLAEYALYGFLLARALLHSFDRLTPSRLILFSALGAGLYGVTDEIHQSFVPGRDASFGDIVADTIGGLIGVLTYIWLHNLKRKKSR